MSDPFNPPDDFLRSEHQDQLFEIIGFRNEASLDPHTHDVFWQVMYNDELTVLERQFYYDELVAYLWNTYGLDFENLWDWEDFRAWYDTVA